MGPSSMLRVLEQRWGWRDRPAAALLLFVGQGLALLAVYRLDVNIVPTVLAALLFALLALPRPDLALLYVPLSLPLAWRAKGIWDAHFEVRDKFLPLHEVILVILTGITLLHLLTAGRARLSPLRDRLSRQALWQALPVLLFVLAGVLGVALALPEGRDEALRQLRRVILEPLIVYLLVRYWARSRQSRRRIVAALVAGGAALALLGVLQLAGIDLAPTDGISPCHSNNVEATGGVLRVSSLYCHPNNLGLYLGRIWPLAAALAWGAYRGRRLRRLLLWGCGMGLALLGLLLSFSKGAMLGALVALLVLLGFGGRRRLLLSAGGALLAILLVAVLVGPERLNPFGGSSNLRLSVYRSALDMLADHPLLGIGLGQFFYYYNPEFGHGYIRPEAQAAQELYTAHPHNLLLDLLLQLGVLGLLAFAWLVVRLLSRCLAQRSDAGERYLLLGLCAATAAGLAHGLVDQGYFYPDLAIFFWLSLGLAEMATQQSESSNRRPEAA